jgi:WD40 repeat protein
MKATGLRLISGRIQRERTVALHERAIAVASRNTLIVQQAEALLDRDPTLALEWLKTYPPDGAAWNRVQAIAADAYSRGIARHVLPGGPVHSSAVSPDGRFLFTGGPQQPVRQWDLQSGTLIRSASLGSFVNGLRVSPDGTRVALCDRDGHIVLWSPGTDERRTLGTQNGTVYGIEFSPDGPLASSGTDRIDIWNLQTAQQRTLRGRWGSSALAFSPTDRLLATGGSDGVLRLWDSFGGARRNLLGHTKSINDISFSPDGSLIASASDDRSVRLWQVSSGRGRILDLQRIVRQLSDYERGVWTPKPGERVRIATASGDEPFVTTTDDGLARVFVVELFLAGGDLFQTYRSQAQSQRNPWRCQLNTVSSFTRLSTSVAPGTRTVSMTTNGLALIRRLRRRQRKGATSRHSFRPPCLTNAPVCASPIKRRRNGCGNDSRPSLPGPSS